MLPHSVGYHETICARTSNSGEDCILLTVGYLVKPGGLTGCYVNKLRIQASFLTVEQSYQHIPCMEYHRSLNFSDLLTILLIILKQREISSYFCDNSVRHAHFYPLESASAHVRILV